MYAYKVCKNSDIAILGSKLPVVGKGLDADINADTDTKNFKYIYTLYA